MIQANEFRIGNHVKGGALHTGIGFDYYTISQIHETVVFFKESHVGEYFKDIQQIPLTEEWLLKFGFEKLDSDITEYWRNGLVISLDVNNNWFNSLGRKIVIKYVHTLQNLFFALTDEELTINEKK